MGVNDREQNRRDDRRRAKEKTFKLKGSYQTGGQVADWGGADPELLRRFIVAATGDDGAIRFGYSRDGGAYSVGVYAGGQSETLYIPCTEDIDEWLKQSIEELS